MRNFKTFCAECIDPCKHRSAKKCPYINYYKANKDMYITNAENNPGMLKNKSVIPHGFTKKQVLELVRQGMRTKDIAIELNISHQSTRFHLTTLIKEGIITDYPNKSCYTRKQWQTYWKRNDKRILKLYQEGKSFLEINRILGKSNYNTIRDRLRKMGAIK